MCREEYGCVEVTLIRREGSKRRKVEAKEGRSEGRSERRKVEAKEGRSEGRAKRRKGEAKEGSERRKGRSEGRVDAKEGSTRSISSYSTRSHGTSTETKHYTGLIETSKTHFYGRAAAELSFSDSVLRTFTRLLGAVSSFTHNSVSARDRTNHTPCEGADHAAILLVDCWYGWKDQDKKRPCITSATTCVSITRG